MPAPIVINIRDRSRRMSCPIITLAAPSSGGAASGPAAAAPAAVCICEPYAVYRLPSGEWWLEFYRFHSLRDIQALATATGATLHLPRDFDGRWELLRDVDRSHCRCVCGGGGGAASGEGGARLSVRCGGWVTIYCCLPVASG